MLEYNVLQTAYELNATIQDRGVAVRPVAGSVLEDLVDGAAPVSALGMYDRPVSEGDVISAISGISPVRVLTNSSLERDPDDEYRHGRVLDEVVNKVAQAVRVDHGFARNTVNPVIRQIVEAVETGERLRAGESDLRPNVIPYFYADIWENASWNAIVERFADQPLVKVIVPTAIALSEEINPVELLTEASAKFGFASAVTELLKAHNEDWAFDVFRGVFGNDTEALYKLGLEIRVDVDGWLFPASRFGVDAVVAAHLMARALLNKEPTAGYSKRDWETAVSTVIGATGQRLYRATKQRKEDRQRQVLVFSYDYVASYTNETTPKRGDIVVNGDLYNDYLEKGGSPEALMGASYASQARGFTELLESNEALQVAYRKHEAVIAETYAANKFSRVLESVRIELMKYLNSIPEAEQAFSREVYVKTLRDELTTFTSNDIGALWYFVRRVVCKVFFPHTNALRVLTKIDDVAERMPEASVQVATYHATLEILVDWLWAQVAIEQTVL